MYYRRKILLSLLQVFGGRLPKIDFQKYLFLLNVKKENAFFEFIPYKYGGFSFQANQDMSTMVKYNLVEESENYWKVVEDKDYLAELKMNDKILISKLYNEFNLLRGNDLVKFVYERYPYYAINSLIAENLLEEKDYENVVNSRPCKNVYTLYTIGYEGKSVEHFTNELIEEDIRVLCDIRKNAFSMKYGFSKKQLKLIVENVGIKYLHIPELGIDSAKRQGVKCKEDYELLFKDYEENTLRGKSEKLEELHKIFIENKRIALMCFEADHKSCHRSRTIKVLRKLNKRECNIKHL